MPIPTRTANSIKGLVEFVDYIAKRHDVSKLTILEIGSWAGTSASVFAKRFKSVICVDAWQPIKDTITERHDMKAVEIAFDSVKARHKNIRKIKHFSYEVAPMFDNNSIDIVYIDGEHTYRAVKKDIEDWLPKCRLFIAGHDYWPGKFPGVIKAVHESIGEPDRVFPDTSWIQEVKR